MDTIDKLKEEGKLSEDEVEEARLAALGIRPRAGSGEGGVGGGKIAETETKGIIDDATDAFKSKLGIKYDENRKQDMMWDPTGKKRIPITPEMERKLDAGLDVIRSTVRDARVGNKRVGMTDVLNAAAKTQVTPAAPVAAGSPKPQFTQGQLVVNAKGQRAKYGGIDAAGKTIWLRP